VLHLRLDTSELGDAELRGRLLLDIAQQGRLPDARFTMDDQDRALARKRTLVQPVENLSLSRPTSHGRSDVARHSFEASATFRSRAPSFSGRRLTVHRHPNGRSGRPRLGLG